MSSVICVLVDEDSREKPWNQLQIRRYLASQATSDFAAEVPHLLTAKPTNSSLILAAGRTRRKDPLNHFKLYTGGWNITNRHYLAVSLFSVHSNNHIHSNTEFLTVYSRLDSRQRRCSRHRWSGLSCSGLHCYGFVFAIFTCGKSFKLFPARSTRSL